MFIPRKKFDNKLVLLSYFTIFVFIILIFIAMILYDNYQVASQTLSKLGAKYPSMIFFSLALLLSCISTAILSSNIVYILYSKKTITEKKATRIMIFLIIFLCCMVGVVIFPSTTGIISFIHDSVAVTLFVCMTFATGIISSNLFKDKLTYNSKVEYSAYLGFITCLSALIYALVNPFFEFSPIFQKITVILFMIWLPLTHYNLKIQND